jgi:hypothetical protein
MDRYLIETPHTEQNCRDLVGLVNAAGYLNHFDWGCMGGVHSGWAIIEAENERRRGSLCRLWFVARRAWSRSSNLLSRC